jgi:hypothetical protein
MQFTTRCAPREYTGGAAMKVWFKICLTIFSSLFLCIEGFTQSSSSGGDVSGWDDKTDRWRFKHEVQIGDFLTSVTLMAGFSGFLIATIKDRRKKAQDEERSGALRLLLKILRENHGPMELVDLRRVFEATETKGLREAYCGKRFSLDNKNNSFEALVYRLHWEGKVDFLPGDKITFRLLERFDSGARPTTAVVPPSSETFTIFKNAFLDPKTEMRILQDLAHSSLTYDRKETSQFLAESAKSPDRETQHRAVILLGKFAPRNG